ncbi:GtrA family protein [Rhodococcus sp. ACPA4]|jgi:putative flippase GtrA|uniref:GtrA family protein n=1 Tax=Rhodococcus TaxID=1827 RepID=UPI0005D43344|nr:MULTISPECIES: GtrA family protein [Rhodococcus]KJF24065.1 GtrA-like protein [Rhodococcus sp. AD45]MCE4268760.1 GtrA family protein [Rhodococcus globerulus]NRI69419.1 GtrA family protein [Rhodococcus sp. MS16]PBC42886.1 GtrA family protein [Rhodococcus sp. ACPA4]PSR42407.1 GtrA family protein [Rhodococcus sp. AD45-ID]
MAFVGKLVNWLPEKILVRVLPHAEMLKFLVVGGIAFIVTTVLFFGIKWTVLPQHPVTANIIAVLVATVLSYVLNREWSFAERGGRQRHHEAALFFIVAGIGLAINQVPLWISSYVFDLRQPNVSVLMENFADFISGSIIGTLLATAFRWWAMRKFVFPEESTNGEMILDTEATDAPSLD